MLELHVYMYPIEKHISTLKEFMHASITDLRHIMVSCFHQVAPHGWSEGECNGEAGWFPSAYVERQDKAPSSKIA